MSIDDWRRRIDEIDQKLVLLLSERARCALEIGHEKEKAGLPIYQPEREVDILAKVEAKNPGPLSHAAVRRLFERIIDEARSLERSARGGAKRGEAKPSGASEAGDKAPHSG